MAGSDPTGSFDPDLYREQIRAVRMMGLPEDDAMKPIFHFAAAPVVASADPGNRPWDFTQPREPSSVPEPDPIMVLCGIVVDAGQKAYTAAGKFEATTATLAFFEDEWDLIGAPAAEGGFSRVFIGGKPYKRGATQKPGTLFEVTTYRVEVIAEDL